VVKSRNIQFYDQFFSGFRESLTENRRDAVIDEYDIENKDTLAAVSAGGYDILCVLGTETTKSIKKEISGKPIVFSMILNPVATKVVETMAPAGGNITGVALDFDAATQLRLLKKILPAAGRVGVIYGSQSVKLVDAARALENELNIKIVAAGVDSSIKVPAALKDMGSAIDVLWLIPDLTVCTKESLPYILEYAGNAKIPMMVFAPYLVKAGGLFSYTYDYKDIGKQTAEVTAKIINGESAGSIPIAVPRKAGFVINKKVIENFNLKISSDILSEADEVY
jgi:putative ABC transport system substrate-binding protein